MLAQIRKLPLYRQIEEKTSPGCDMRPKNIAETSDNRRIRRENIVKLTALLPFLRPYWIQVMIAGLALLIAAGTVLSLGGALKGLVDHGLAAGNPHFLDGALMGLLGVVLLLAIASACRFYFVTWIGERVVADLRQRIFGQLLRQDITFYETTKAGELVSRLTADATLLQTVIGSSLSMAMRNALTGLGAAAMLVLTSPKLSLLVFLIVPLVVFPIVFFGRKVRRLSRESQEKLGLVGGFTEEAITGIRTVQAFTAETFMAGRFDELTELAFMTAIQRIKARAFLVALVISIAFGSIAVVLWTGGRDVLAHRMSGGDLSAFIFYAVLLAGSVGALSEVAGDLQRASGALERLLEIMGRVPGVNDPVTPVMMSLPVKGAIEFERVNFCYPSRPDTAAIDDLSIHIKSGQRVAIVGPSGAGKSTILQLLLRCYDPASGDIKIDGQSIRNIRLQDLRRCFGVVSQDPAIFADTVAMNIGFGKPGASDAEIRTAAKSAFATEFIDALPDGMNTPLGERGVRLSGGQKQRIAIARAILRDPPILLLDEATSALDAESERAVQAALEKLMQGRTSLVIAHRLATIRNADLILVLDHGRLVGQGSHDELVQSNPLYAHLAALQFNLAETG